MAGPYKTNFKEFFLIGSIGSLKFLKDPEYEGKFGLQCYNIEQDCEVALTKSINTWKEYKKMYAGEKKD